MGDTVERADTVPSMSAPTELTYVEQPLLDQLAAMGWQVAVGNRFVPYLTDEAPRDSFHRVILKERLAAAILRINVDDEGNPWLDDARVGQALQTLERLSVVDVMAANVEATGLLLHGTEVLGLPSAHGQRMQSISYIDFDDWENNDFLAVSQFRVDPPGNTRPSIIPDIVLFVNGIPVVVIECKSPNLTDPMEEALDQLLRYSNQRGWIAAEEGAERLFHYAQLMVASSFEEALVGTLGATEEHYTPWKDPAPCSVAEVRDEVGLPSDKKLSPQQSLVAGTLRPAHLLDIIRVRLPSRDRRPGCFPPMMP